MMHKTGMPRRGTRYSDFRDNTRHLQFPKPAVAVAPLQVSQKREIEPLDSRPVRPRFLYRSRPHEGTHCPIELESRPVSGEPADRVLRIRLVVKLAEMHRCATLSAQPSADLLGK